MITTRTHTMTTHAGQTFVLRFQVDPILDARWTLGARPGSPVQYRADKTTYEGTRPTTPVQQSFEFATVHPGETMLEIDLVDGGGRMHRREIYAISVLSAEQPAPTAKRGAASALLAWASRSAMRLNARADATMASCALEAEAAPSTPHGR